MLRETGDQLQKIKLAAVQASGVHLDRDATVQKACKLIREAGKAGASLIAFPEGFIPAHPCWFSVRPGTDRVSFALSKALFQNSVVIPSAATDTLGDACREAKITAVIGVCEKYEGTTGTMFNTQLFIGPDGSILGKHQKLMPTLAERIVHTGGHGDTLKAYKTPFGMVSSLICGENANPLAAYGLMTQYPLVHVASWPSFVSPTVKLSEVILSITKGLAYSMGTFVVNAAGYLTQDMIDSYEAGDVERGFMEKLLGSNNASIISPRGVLLTEPMEGEGILYADVDLNDTIPSKIAADFAGHYNRPDVFEFRVREDVPSHRA